MEGVEGVIPLGGCGGGSQRQAATTLRSALECIIPVQIAACIVSSPVVSCDGEIHSTAKTADVMPVSPPIPVPSASSPPPPALLTLVFGRTANATGLL